MTKINAHIRHYTPLIGIMFAGIIGFSLFAFDRNFQFIVAIAVSASYVTWGIIHHYLHKDLYAEVIFEYIIMAILGLVLIFSVIFRA